MYKLILRLFMSVYLLLVKSIYAITKNNKKNNNVNNKKLLITGKFYSENWFFAHIKPLSQAKNVKIIYLVTDCQMPAIEKVVFIIPSDLLKLIFGKSLARLLIFIYYGFKVKPDVIIGYHLLLNGLVALLFGMLCGARTLYNCGGGIREILGGGYTTENKIFGKLDKPDYFIENKLLESIKLFNFIIVRGTKTKKWIEAKGYKNNICIITGGIDEEIFCSDLNVSKDIDIILSARISEIKRLDIFIETIKILSNSLPELKVLVVGDGPLLPEIKSLAMSMSVEKNIRFLGHQDNVANFLRKSKIFVLTSDSEGVSLSMIEAMLCGLPVVVSDVGDLGDFVENGVNGYLIKGRLAKDFATPIETLLKNDNKRESYGQAAYDSACKARLNDITKKWENLLGGN